MTALRVFLVASFAFCGLPATNSAERPSQGVMFNGDTSHAIVDDGDAFDLDAFTLSVWVKPGQRDDSQILMGRGEVGSLFTFYFHEGRVRMLVEYQPGKYTHANCPIPPKNEWTHLAGSYDGEQIKLYVNGSLQGTAPAPGRIARSNAPLFIGALSPGRRTLLGQIEDIRVWRHALKDEVIAAVAAGDQGITRRDALVGRWMKEGQDEPNWPNAAGPHLTAEYRTDFWLRVRKADGYRGIWYQCGEQGGEYKYKYSGGLGTYCAKHRPFAIYVQKVNKTFFCYGGTDVANRTLFHMVSLLSTAVLLFEQGFSTAAHALPRRRATAVPDDQPRWSELVGSKAADFRPVGALSSERTAQEPNRNGIQLPPPSPSRWKPLENQPLLHGDG